MSYARPCKYCGIQVIWDDKLTSTNKFKELDTNEQHSQERCKAIQAGQLQQTPTTKPQQQQSGETAKTVWRRT